MMEQVCLPDRNRKKRSKQVTLPCIPPVAVRRHPLRRVITRPRPKADLRACACGHLPHDAEAFYPWLRGNGLTRLGGASPLDCPLRATMLNSIYLHATISI